MATRIQLRRGTTAEWTSVNPVLAAGEVGVELDTNKFKIGDGVKSWNNLSYAVQTDLSKLNNDAGFITINDVEAAGYTKNVGTVKSVNNVEPNANGNVSLSIPSKTSDLTNDSNFTTLQAVANEGYTKNKGTVTQVNDSTPDASGKVTIAIPPEVTDSTVSGWGYTKNAGTVTKVNNTAPDAQGNVSIAIPAEVTETTVTNWGFTKNTGTVTQVNDSTPDANGKVTIAIPPEVTDSTVSGWGYTKNAGTVTSVNNVEPVDGNVSLNIPTEVTEETVAEWGYTKNEGTVKSVNNAEPDENGNVTIEAGSVNPGKALKLSEDTHNYSELLGDYRTPFVIDENGIATSTTLSLACLPYTVEKRIFKIKIDNTFAAAYSDGAISGEMAGSDASGIVFNISKQDENYIAIVARPDEEPLTVFNVELDTWYYSVYEKTNEDDQYIYFNYYITKDLEDLGTAYSSKLDKSKPECINLTQLQAGSYIDMTNSFYVENGTTKYLLEKGKSQLNVLADNETLTVNYNNKLAVDTTKILTRTEANETFQEKLVSGTNIKTINNQSILGEGNIEIQGGDNASWGNITGTLSEQTDLNTELGKKLESTNLVQGSNITLTKSGNNITIAATGEISGSVEYENIEGSYQSASELSKDIGTALSTAETLAKNLGENAELRFPLREDIYSNTGGLSSGTIVTRAHIAEEDCVINKICVGTAHVPQNPFITHVDLIEFDYENNGWKVLARSTVTISEEENTLDTPLFVKKGQALGFSYDSNSGMHLGYLVQNVQTYPKYNVLLWGGTDLAKSGTASTITNPTSGYKLNWWFKNDNYISIPNYIEELNNKVSLEKYSKEVTPIYNGLNVDKEETCSTTSVNSMSGTGNWSWVHKALKAEHEGEVVSLTIKIASSTTFPTNEKTISIGTMSLEETDPTTGAGNYTWTDKLLDIVIPSIDSSYREKSYTFTLPRPLKANAGDYIVIGGHSTPVALSYNSLSEIASGLNQLSGTQGECWENVSGTFSGFKQQYYLPGLTFKVNYKEVLDVQSAVNGLDSKILVNATDIYDIKNDLMFKTNTTDVYTKVFTTESSASKMGPATVFWIDKRDRIVKDGYITKIKTVKNNSETDITAAIAAFTIEGEAGSDTATITRIQKFTLPANTKEYVFKSKEAFEVHAGETVGVCIPDQLYHGGAGVPYNIINGGSINSEVGTQLSGHYNGNLQVQVQFEISNILDINGKFDLVNTEINELDERTSDLQTRTSYKDLTSVMLVGSSLTEASYCPTYTSWPERLQDRTDITIVNNGQSGANIYSNLKRVKANNMRFNPTCTVADIHPTYTLWDDCANGSPTGKTAIELYKKVKDCVESLGSKLLMGSEENYANSYKAYEATQQAFANEAKIPYSPITRIQQWCYPRNNTAVCPYPVNGASHSGYRANAPYSVHQDLINSLPIYKNVKMFRPRTTYKNGNPEIQDLVYDNIDQRLKYWTALHPGQGASTAPGHIDNLDDASKDVPNTTNVNPYGSTTEPNALFLGNPLQFNKYGLVEFILEKTGITKGTFEIQTSIEPTKIYIANNKSIEIVGANGNTNYTVGQIIIYPQVNKFYRVLQNFTSNPGFNPEPTSEQAEVFDFDNYIATEFEEIPFTYVNGMISASLTEDRSKNYQLYDKVRFVVYYAGGIFTLAKPSFYGYDGKNKVLPETIDYHRRKFGTELLDACNPSSWTKTGTAETKSLPAPIANYTLYNDTLTHIQLNSDGDSISKTVTIANPGYKRIAVRIVGQIWNKIATTRFNGTEFETNEYITNTKDDPLGAAAYINSDFDYGILKVALITPGNTTYDWKNILVYPGWSEAYFEADLQPEDTMIGIRIAKASFVDDSYVNADKPIFIHHVSIQEIG